MSCTVRWTQTSIIIQPLLKWLLNSGQRLMDSDPPHFNTLNFGIYTGKAHVLIKQTISTLKQLFIGSA